jgi:hypothetical protein
MSQLRHWATRFTVMHKAAFAEGSDKVCDPRQREAHMRRREFITRRLCGADSKGSKPADLPIKQIRYFV